MPTHRRRAALVIASFLSLALPSCGASVAVDTPSATGDPDAGAGGAAPDGGGSPDGGDAGPAPPAQCHCPGAPGYMTCVLPMECCPVVGVCKNPASFSCTGSDKPCP